MWALSPNNFNGDNGNDNAFNVNNNGNLNNNNVNNNEPSFRPAISRINGYLIALLVIVERCLPETSMFPWGNPKYINYKV